MKVKDLSLGFCTWEADRSNDERRFILEFCRKTRKKGDRIEVRIGNREYQVQDPSSISFFKTRRAQLAYENLIKLALRDWRFKDNE